MSSNAITSMGAQFYRWSGSGWVEIAEVTGIEGPGKTRETIEVTTLASADGYREFIGSLREGGDVVLQMNFWRASYEILNDDFEDDSVQNYAIQLADTAETVLEFEGLVTELPLTAAVGEKVTANATIRVTGKPTLADGSSGFSG